MPCSYSRSFPWGLDAVETSESSNLTVRCEAVILLDESSEEKRSEVMLLLLLVCVGVCRSHCSSRRFSVTFTSGLI